MRKILIVGAGQAGLRLAHGLLNHDYDVTLISGASSLEVRTGHPAITQFTMPTALGDEQGAELAMWDHLAPRITGATMRLFPPGGDPHRPLLVQGPLGDGHAVSVDRRVKMADWMEYFEDRGGKVVIHGITVTDLDYFSRMFELIIIAVGHGELGQLFDQAPPLGHGQARAVAQVILSDVPLTEHEQWHPVKAPPGAPPGMMPEPVASDHADVASTPEVRSILAPILTSTGPQHVLQLVSPLDGVLARWPDRPKSAETLRLMRHVLREHVPYLADRISDAMPAPGWSTSVHKYTPHVRHPVAHLPGGGPVLGLADAVVATDDPVAAQGWNVSNASALHYLQRILDHGEKPFTEDWMFHTFQGVWSGTPDQGYPYAGTGQAALALSEVLDVIWSPHAPPHLTQVLAAAAEHPEVAQRFLGVLDNPHDAAWLADPDTASAYLSTLA